MSTRRISGVLTTAAGALLCASAPAFAAEAWLASTIKSVYPLANGVFVLFFDVDSPACTSSATSKYYYVIPNQNGMTEEGAKRIYAAAMLAFSMEKIVDVAFDSATSGCNIDRLSVRK